jgi:hypothetical protein
VEVFVPLIAYEKELELFYAHSCSCYVVTYFICEISWSVRSGFGM